MALLFSRFIADRGAGQPLLAQPFSKPTQRNDSAIVRTSPWKPRSPTYIRSEHQAPGALPSLQSLKWDPRMGYSTIAERLAAVPSSGYGQKYIESAAQSALGMSLQVRTP